MAARGRCHTQNDVGTKLENLTVGENVTVAGLLVDDDTTDTTDEPGEVGEKARYTAVAADADDTKTPTAGAVSAWAACSARWMRLT